MNEIEELQKNFEQIQCSSGEKLNDLENFKTNRCKLEQEIISLLQEVHKYKLLYDAMEQEEMMILTEERQLREVISFHQDEITKEKLLIENLHIKLQELDKITDMKRQEFEDQLKENSTTLRESVQKYSDANLKHEIYNIEQEQWNKQEYLTFLIRELNTKKEQFEKLQNKNHNEDNLVIVTNEIRNEYNKISKLVSKLQEDVEKKKKNIADLELSIAVLEKDNQKHK